MNGGSLKLWNAAASAKPAAARNELISLYVGFNPIALKLLAGFGAAGTSAELHEGLVSHTSSSCYARFYQEERSSHWMQENVEEDDG